MRRIAPLVALVLAAALVAGCSNSRQDQRTRGAIVGGATGAAVGSLFGSGTGKTVATGAGAVIGSIAGAEIADPGPRRRPRRR
ncbi:MAG TPA: glycine zipper 2TM domain-containing protein [Paracoccaceae bacterium]|nr:glycine zipper 2TM domain-containing protein [Paracoccaceae bacterium]